MTDNQTNDPQRDIQRLTEELARREHENSDLKQELARTVEVQGDLWSHDIYLRARRKMLAGVIAILGVLSAFGLVTVYELYQRGLNYFDDKMMESISARVQDDASTRVQTEARRMMGEAGKKVDQRIDKLVVEKKEEISSLFEKTERDFATAISVQAEQADLKIESLIVDAEDAIKTKVSELERSVQDEGDALSKRIKQYRVALQTTGEATGVDTEMSKVIVDCDPNYLDAAQIDHVGIRQISEGTGRTVQNKWEVFKNTFFLDVHGADGSASSAAEAMCILDAVDRVVYGADPNWYSPSEFVRIDRENDFSFTVSGWGPTVLTAQVYFTGRREPIVFEGKLAISSIARADKKYLGDTQQEFQ